MRLSAKVKNLPPSPTLVISAEAKRLADEGKEICNLSVGEPDFPSPPSVCEAAQDFLAQGYVRYTNVAGTLPLRKKIATHLRETKNLSFTEDEVLVATGAKQGLFESIMALIGEGDEVIIPAPYWVSYPTQVTMAGGTPVFVHTDLEHGFQIDLEAIKAALTPYTKMLILCSPNNPSGAVYTQENLKGIAELVKKHGIWLLCDEIYDELYTDGNKPVSPLALAPEIKDQTIIINGFSKAFSMTGWRLGYVAAPKPVIQACKALQGSITSGTSTVSQHAGEAALKLSSDYFAKNRATFEKRLDLVMKELEAIEGMECQRPQGAFYVFPDVTAFLGLKTASGDLIESSLQLATFLLQEAGVACVPGEAFGLPGYLRFSYATDETTLKAAFTKCRQALATLIKE